MLLCKVKQSSIMGSEIMLHVRLWCEIIAGVFRLDIVFHSIAPVDISGKIGVTKCHNLMHTHLQFVWKGCTRSSAIQDSTQWHVLPMEICMYIHWVNADVQDESETLHTDGQCDKFCDNPNVYLTSFSVIVDSGKNQRADQYAALWLCASSTAPIPCSSNVKLFLSI